MTQTGNHNTSASVPWRKAYPEYSDEDLPGVCLRGSRYRKGLTQKQLADMTGIPQRHISEMENGKRTIGKEMASRLVEWGIDDGIFDNHLAHICKIPYLKDLRTKYKTYETPLSSGDTGSVNQSAHDSLSDRSEGFIYLFCKPYSL
jgi:transcriptional regulator with XRE-family HTH domain